MQSENDEGLNRLLASEGSVEYQARIASQLDDEQLQRAVTHNRYAKVEWERRLAQRVADAVNRLGDKITGLMETIYRASQGIQEKTDNLLGLFDRISQSQKRQQNIVIVLTVVLALSTLAYTLITWLSVSAMNEANEIQRQVLQIQRVASEKKFAPNPTAETDARKSGARGSP